MPPPPPISNTIRRLRFDHGEMTQQQLADAIGMTRQTVAAIEQNKYSPSLEAAFRIAEVFGVEIGAVFQWKADHKPQA
ncbi:helix-turn-helix transcriptional regulator [Devosia ureilytica]|uniref:Helix-turn-helix transcriptional regulator n=1 Tax=Devosia ureilytica TaxID=2952754 RepID=A0A9Q4ARJ0_9HYPH|nr:helix-turn-helix transcriptional regulator [Devosia ureilytica]MCP8888560.1 helix-turn-helix transcriptional regulator [Devosia ureilytica]